MGKVACVHCPYDTVWILGFDDRLKSHVKLFACDEFIMVIEERDRVSSTV